MRYAKVSEIIFALEQLKEMYGDKEVCQLRLKSDYTEELLEVDFDGYETGSIEIITKDILNDNCS